MTLSSARVERTQTLSNEKERDREAARAVRARQRAIGRELRRMYDGIVNEPVPEEFLDLVHKLEGAEGSGGPTNTKSS